MNLFVGEGPADPMHGKMINVLPRDGHLPETYTDIARAVNYMKREVTNVDQVQTAFGVNITGWRVDVYLHESLISNPQAAQGALIDAIARLWFRSNGEEVPVHVQQQAQAGTSPGNGGKPT